MKKFIYDIIKFSLFLFMTILVLVIFSLYLNNNIDFKIPKHKEILVVGDSRPECAINDQILDNVFNYSQSGASYFYSYLKIREIIKNNSHIKTLVLSYSYADLSKSRDKWYVGHKRINNYMPMYFPLFNLEDFIFLFKSNPYSVTITMPVLIKSIFIKNNQSNLGGYRHLKRDKLKEAIKRYKFNRALIKNVVYSKYQAEYLLKIYNFVQKKNIKLILLSLPIYNIPNKNCTKYNEFYKSFAKKNLNKAILINHSNFELPEISYGDLGHLNYKGAKIYSKYLKSSGILN